MPVWICGVRIGPLHGAVRQKAADGVPRLDVFRVRISRLPGSRRRSPYAGRRGVVPPEEDGTPGGPGLGGMSQVPGPAAPLGPETLRR
ncbi:hypothetical protein Hesp01_54640 [Herbidospora sp. NBRC 101105]|nr:hypothetical protein Hesp01_54640 [Herbidospora sp. NBRC 101105]